MRGNSHRAAACILLVNKNSQHAVDDDYKNILNALSIKKAVYNVNKDGKDDEHFNMRIIMQLLKPDSKFLYYSSLNLSPLNDQLIIVEEIKMNILAKSCFAPGLITLISNLVASQGNINTDNFEEDWIKEYAAGMGYEIYRVKIDEYDFQNGFTFGRIAEIALKNYSTIVFAMEI
jgi:hypothetical protein